MRVSLPGWQAVVVPLLFFAELVVMAIWYLIKLQRSGTDDPAKLVKLTLRYAKLEETGKSGGGEK